MMPVEILSIENSFKPKGTPELKKLSYKLSSEIFKPGSFWSTEHSIA